MTRCSVENNRGSLQWRLTVNTVSTFLIDKFFSAYLDFNKSDLFPSLRWLSSWPQDILHFCEELCVVKALLSPTHLNAHRVKNKDDKVDISAGRLKWKFNILVFTQTWLACDTDVVETAGCKCETVLRRNRMSWDVAIYRNDRFKDDILPYYRLLTSSLSLWV